MFNADTMSYLSSSDVASVSKCKGDVDANTVQLHVDSRLTHSETQGKNEITEHTL